MQTVNLLNLIQDVSSWEKLEAQISSLSLEIERGEAFEEFCKAFFLLDPVFQFKEVYRHREIPPSLCERIGYPGRQDIGIDGLAVTIDGKLFAYQAKFRSDRSNTPTLRELSTFFTVSDRADWRITITNANSLPSAINDRTKQSRILADRLDQLDSDFFNRFRIYLKEQRVSSPTNKTPHKTQREAIDVALAYFKEQSRGQLILPCGAGKTLAAMWIAEEMGCSRLLILVPSLALMSQTLKEWAANTSIKPFRYLCLCSDTTVDLGNDSPIEHRYELDVPVTTDVERVAEFLADNHSTNYVLFSTYQSSKVLSEAVLKTGTVFDIAIFDEAHRTTGTNVGVWCLALRDEKIQVKKRLFMTATPRIYAPHITKKAKEEDVLICSMDDPTVYGKPFYEMTFGVAIERGHITDYKIVVICVTDSEVKEIIQRGGRVITDDEQEWDAKAFAKRIALVKGMNAYGLKKVFTFHGRVKGAKAFTDTKTPYGIYQVFKMLDLENNNQKEIKFFHVNGTMSSGLRNNIMKEFEEVEVGIMSNARCLIEGVDVPAVDTVAFVDPKRSLIDIVQATGRAMRKAEWKDKGYIFIPVFVEEDADPEKFIRSSDFDTVWEVLQAMEDQDQRLEDIVSNLRIMQGKGEEGTQAWKDAMIEYTERVEFYNLPTRIDKTNFINTLYAKTIEVIGSTWDKLYGELVKYKNKYGDCTVPQRWSENTQLGKWIQHQREAKNKGILNKVRIEKLNNIGFVLDVLESSLEEMYYSLVNYKQAHGHCNVPLRWPKNKQLGIWVATQRGAKKHRNLSKERIERLNKLGFVWDTIDAYWKEMFNSLANYRQIYGHCNVPITWTENQRLSTWVHNMRRAKKKGILSEKYVQRLDAICFEWEPYKENWESMFNSLDEYRKIYGHCNVPYRWSYNPQLGFWVSRQRKAKKLGKLSEDRIERLNKSRFIWDKFDAYWEEMFTALGNYKNSYGDCNVPRNWPNNPQLAAWVSNQRNEMRRGNLNEERTRRLEKIGFVWEPVESSWENMFAMLVEYNKSHGNCNVPQNWQENPQLAEWVSKKRLSKKNGKLSDEQILLLNQIGFLWEPLKARWEEMYTKLVEFKKLYGHCNVPQHWPSKPKLGKWLSHQQEACKKNKLPPLRIKMLEKIGFKWQKK